MTSQSIYGCLNFNESADFNLLGPTALPTDSDGFFRTKGTVQHWKKILGPMGRYSSILRLTAAAALAAPLLAMIDEKPFVIVLTGPSSKGKTTGGLYAAGMIGVP